ncbi:MAG: phosphate ABC transporter permease subunit PstC [Campylobacterota bacterium]|nr:phosphate ABC transporter permease subunit PstC [Campylobacterota bacterium]
MAGFQSKQKSIQMKEDIIKYLLISAAGISILTTFGILFSILFEALEFFNLKSFTYFITGSQWSPGTEDSKFGAVAIFAGTFMITAIAIAVALPIGVLSAIYMSEYASENVRTTVKPLLEILAGIPTVVYGFFAAITVAPAIVSICETFGLDASFNSALAAGVVMGIMIIPVISSLSDDVINAVPDSLRKGSLALGMTKSETIKDIVIPSALPGIISATLLAISKALGETMIVVMAAGMNANKFSINPLEDMTTVTVQIVAALTGDFEFDSPDTLSAFALGLVLFAVTLVLNVVSVMMIKKFKEKYKMSNL